jgi:hypothetical protein
LVADVNFDGDGDLDVAAQRRRFARRSERASMLAGQVHVAVALKVHV